MIRPGLSCIVACVALLASSATALAQAPPEAPKAKTPAAPKKPAPAAPPAIGGVQPQLIEQSGEWGVYSATPAAGKVCFVLSQPTSSQTNPPGRTRDPAYMFIASRPADK